jgi:ubiquinone biosynthesis protein Coq4
MVMTTLKKTFMKLRAARGFFDLVKHPEHLDSVFEMADAMAAADKGPLRAMRDFFATDETGARALRDRPRIGRVDMGALAKLPRATLGREFFEHLRANDLDPSALPTRDAPDELSYIRAHLFETHDVWHVMTGFGADVAGEGGLQAFYLAQFPARLGAAILALGFLNTLLYNFDERDVRMRAFVRGWLLGKRARPFFGVDWAKLWEKPLEEVRRDLGVDIDGVEAVLPQAARAHRIAA